VVPAAEAVEEVPVPRAVSVVLVVLPVVGEAAEVPQPRRGAAAERVALASFGSSVTTRSKRWQGRLMIGELKFLRALIRGGSTYLSLLITCSFLALGGTPRAEEVWLKGKAPLTTG